MVPCRGGVQYRLMPFFLIWFASHTQYLIVEKCLSGDVSDSSPT